MQDINWFDSQTLVFTINKYSYSSSVFDHDGKPFVSNKLCCSAKLDWDIEDDIKIKEFFSKKEIDIILIEKNDPYDFENEYTFGLFRPANDFVTLKLNVTSNVINNIISANNYESDVMMPFTLRIKIPTVDLFNKGKNSDVNEFSICF